MVRTALKRPITIMVLFFGLLLFSVMAVRTISIDIFPNLNLPVIYVIQQYGGMTAKQMEGFFSTKMQDNFLYIDGVSNIESKNIQGLTPIKLSFYEGTDMAEASAEIAIQVNRCLSFFPLGALPPEVVWQMQQVMSDYLRVTAPFSGIITERNTHPGALVSAEAKVKPMLELKEVAHLRLQVDIPEGLSTTLKDKDAVNFYLSALPGKKMSAKVSRK